MHLWQGLGYYQRARRIHAAAQHIMQHHQGLFPRTLDALLSIPGIGDYTAGAIMSFAYNDYGPIVDGNVRRFFCRYFGIEGQPQHSAVVKQLWKLAYEYTPRHNNRQFAQALLDIGATVCKPKQPTCTLCPLQATCYAFDKEQQHLFPTPKPKRVLPEKTAYFLWHQTHDRIFLSQRPTTGIWSSLWCLPEVETSHAPSDAEPLKNFKHTFTHYKLDGRVLQTSMTPSCQGKWFTIAELRTIGLPAPIQRLLKQSSLYPTK